MATIQRISTPYSYSSAVIAGDCVFLGLHRGFGETFADQFESAFVALKETLAGLGLTTENIVKMMIQRRCRVAGCH